MKDGTDPLCWIYDKFEESMTKLSQAVRIHFPAAHQVSSIYSLEDLQGLQNPEICSKERNFILLFYRSPVNKIKLVFTC